MDRGSQYLQLHLARRKCSVKNVCRTSKVHLLVTLGLKWPALGGMRFLGVRTMESQCDSSLASLGPSAWRRQASRVRAADVEGSRALLSLPLAPGRRGRTPNSTGLVCRASEGAGPWPCRLCLRPPAPTAGPPSSRPLEGALPGSEQDSVALARQARSLSPSPERTGRLVLSGLGR